MIIRGAFVSKMDEMDESWMEHAVNLINEIDMEENVVHRNAPRIYRENVNAFELHDNDFKRYFRLTKPLTIALIEAVRPQFPVLREGSLIVETKVSIKTSNELFPTTFVNIQLYSSFW